MINGEGGRIAEENRVEYVMDMTETMGTVWLGLTLNCCRCHDHKYDPISNAEYYQFSDFFNQTPVTGAGGDPQTKPTVAYFSTSQQVELGQLKTKLQALKSKRSRIEKNLQAGQAAWEKTKLAELLEPEWEPIITEFRTMTSN